MKFQLLDVEIGLSSSVTTFRWELSSSSMIMTQRGPRFPAMMIESSHPYYDCWSAELRISYQQARPVPIQNAFDRRGRRAGGQNSLSSGSRRTAVR